MRRAVLNTYIDLLGQSDVLHALAESPRRQVLFVGAGVSSEAGVPLAGAICDEIRSKLLVGRQVADEEAWARDTLNWDDATRRYTACLDAYGDAESRVTYFRQMLSDRTPAFAHHAMALLMSRGLLFPTALTTNFDKLLERSFVEQGTLECQAIRTAAEATYWDEASEKCYVFKLHGDYDTHNILNTRPETRSIPAFFLDFAKEFLRARGLLVLGSAGNEESIVEFFKQILATKEARVLSRGVRWGVFVGPRRPKDMTFDAEIDLLQKAIEGGAVSLPIVELLGDMNSQHGDRRPCSFFPVWGSGNLLLDVVDRSADAELHLHARLLLDHDMRLHATFRARNLQPSVIEDHIRKLNEARLRLGQSPPSDLPAAPALRATSEAGREVRVLYGDVTSAATLSAPEFVARRRAVVSPEDTTISAGGGVALLLLTKGGSRYILNELSKLGLIRHGGCAVTSAGKLPVHYILHAAALHLREDGGYEISAESVYQAVMSVFACARGLEVDTLWVPLLGAGVAEFPPAESFKSILRAVIDTADGSEQQVVNVVVYDKSILPIQDARSALDETLGERFNVTVA